MGVSPILGHSHQRRCREQRPTSSELDSKASNTSSRHRQLEVLVLVVKGEPLQCLLQLPLHGTLRAGPGTLELHEGGCGPAV